MNGRTRIKICGITNRSDALLAAECGADALGFIWVPDTPRYLPNAENGMEVPGVAPPYVSRVAVCRAVEEAPQTLGALYDTLQYYEATPALKEWRGRVRLVAAFRIRDAQSLEAMLRSVEAFRPDAVHLDAYHERSLGGSGVSFDWSLAALAKERTDLPIILAGGLNPENVAEAVRQASPYAVDVSSGVEATPGRKDARKVREFCRAVRAADNSPEL